MAAAVELASTGSLMQTRSFRDQKQAQIAEAEQLPADLRGGGLGRSTLNSRTGKEPFTLPTTADIFTYGATVKQSNKEHTLKQRSLPVQEKSTFASSVRAAIPLDLTSSSGWQNPLKKEKAKPAEQSIAAGAVHTGKQEPSRERILDLVAKKREIFLVQMGLDTKRQEIWKLQQQTSQRAQALDKAEKLLDDDSKRFEDFLKQNAESLQEAMSHADTQSKAKNEKIVEIKALSATVANTRRDLMKSEEQLEDAKRLQKFLDELVPDEWREGLVKERDDKHAAKIAVWQAEIDNAKDALEAARNMKADGEAALEVARTQQEADKAMAEIKQASHNIKAALAFRPQPEPIPEPINKDAVYFEEPRQLLDIFDSLEIQNLGLIQSSQEARAALADSRMKSEATKAKMDAEFLALQAQVLLLTKQKQEYETQCNTLKSEKEVAGPTSLRTHSEDGTGNLSELNAKVTECYRICGRQEDSSVNAVAMMAFVEQALVDCLKKSSSIAPNLVEDWEKAREKERRQMARENKKQQEAEEYRARMERATQRAAAPTFKRTGKTPMTRSVLVKKVAKKQVDTAALQAGEELQAYIDQIFP